jgi:Fe(II)/alpha-ketoglutarate-dependent arginine beta-hydroxylase
MGASLIPDLPAGVKEIRTLTRSDCRPESAILLSGVDLGPIVDLPTPDFFGQHDASPAISLADGIAFLLGSLIGTPYCFASQQRGRMVLDVFPLAEHENRQLGCSSTAPLEWHNEDAFHPHRADFTLLCCIRNDQRAATRFVVARDVQLDTEVLRELREPQFVIMPDESHSNSFNAATSGVAADSGGAFARIAAMANTSPRVPVLTGAPHDPLICVDFAYMAKEVHSRRATAALVALREAIEAAACSVVLSPGDVLILDNRRTVHGREGFDARYDGTDRWLRRLNVVRESPVATAGRFAPGTLRVN